MNVATSRITRRQWSTQLYEITKQQARERLYSDGFDKEFPGATRLPVVCQNPAKPSFSWTDRVSSQTSTCEKFVDRTAPELEKTYLLRALEKIVKKFSNYNRVVPN